MEAMMYYGSLDQSTITQYNPQIRNPNFSPPYHHHLIGGVFQPPPPYLSHSYPPYSLRQPPLLPLPTANRRRGAAANRKPSNGNRSRDSSLTPKKSKSSKNEAQKSPNKVATKSAGNNYTIDDGSDCVDTNSLTAVEKKKQVDLFSGSSVFTISPPPSSLPLPTFSLRPKLSCHVEAVAGVDAGATDDLRRLLRLR